MDQSTTVKGLFEFIEKSPSPYHVVDNMVKTYEAAGYERLLENQPWKLSHGGKYFVTKGGTSLIAFAVPEGDFDGFQIVAAHTDSPSFKIKENPEQAVAGNYVKLNVEKYGGMLMAPWFDRPLSVAGRVAVKANGRVEMRLVNVDRDLLVIPNLAIHMNRQVNDGYKYSCHKDMMPLYGAGDSKDTFMQTIAETVGADAKDIIGHDLYLYNRMKGTQWGANNEYISIGKLDDLENVYSAMQALLSANNGKKIILQAAFDNEEVGSGTKQGACSTFLEDTLLRINEAFGGSDGMLRQLIAGSFMLSADNAHATHPNHTEKACPSNSPLMGEGVVIKYSGNQKYTSEGLSAAVFKEICERKGVPVQLFTNHSDIVGGSTLGNLSNAHVSLDSVDIGLAQLAMHSPYETAGAADVGYMIDAMQAFFEAVIEENIDESGETVIEIL